MSAAKDSEKARGPKASIVIACYNAVNTLDRAVESALSQCDGSVEIILVDDCSTDDTAPRLQELAKEDDRIRHLATKENSGPAAARNVAIEAARGEWLAILDADDRMVEGRLERLISRAEGTGHELLFDGVAATDPTSGNRWRHLFEHLAEGPLDCEFFIRHTSPHSRWQIGLLKPVFRRSILGTSRYREDLRYGEDMVFACELLLKRPGWFDGEIGYEYSMQEEREQVDESSRTIRNVDDLSKAYQALIDLLNCDVPQSSGELKIARRNFKRVNSLKGFIHAKTAFRNGQIVKALAEILKSPYAMRVALRRFL